MSKFFKSVRVLLASVTIVSLLLLVSGCGKGNSPLPNYTDNAVGIIIVNDQNQLPQNEKIYADFTEYQYTYDLDVATIYYFDYDSETAIAGGQNVTALTFGADIDGSSVGAEATVSFIDGDVANSTVTAYYLYFDGEGIYFEPDKPFANVDIDKNAVINGSDFPAKIALTYGVPVDHFTVTCYQNNAELQSETFDPKSFMDYYKYALPERTDHVEIVSFDANGEIVEQKSFTNTERNFTVGYDIGGQIMGAKTLYLMWND